jgi:DNA ligase-1
MRFAQLVETSGRIAETSKRLEKIELLAGLLRGLSADEAEIAAAFLSGQTRQGKIGVGYATISALRGDAAAASVLELIEVDQILAEIQSVRGGGSTQRRGELLRSLYRRATEPEQRFLSGLLAGEIRQGALEGIMADGLAKAHGLPAAEVRRAVMMAGDLPAVARGIATEGAAALDRYEIQLFRPVQPMLAQSAEDVDQALAEFGEAALEYKMDGARVQVHKSGDDVRIYTRQLNDVTVAAPEVVEAVRALPARELILDGEVIALAADGRPLPFQLTMRRFGRRLDIEKMRGELPLTPFWFDILYADGGPLIDEAQSRRFAALAGLSPSQHLIPNLVTSDPARAREFAERALATGHEGVMAKALAAPYAAGARGQNWLKVKQPRTLDLVILAAEWGSGRRKGWLSNLHLGARDTEKGGFAMLGKTFKGLTDEMLQWQTARFQELEIGRDSYTVFVEPKIVVEIAFNEIQVSPRYVSGLALRFARVKRYRTDKTPDQADTFQTVQEMAIPLLR